MCHLVLDFKNSHKIIFIVSEHNIELQGEFEHSKRCQFYAPDCD